MSVSLHNASLEPLTAPPLIETLDGKRPALISLKRVGADMPVLSATAVMLISFSVRSEIRSWTVIGVTFPYLNVIAECLFLDETLPENLHRML